jgi:N-acetylneuraminic acid mutarotase
LIQVFFKKLNFTETNKFIETNNLTSKYFWNFSKTALPEARERHTIANMNSKIFLFGGFGDNKILSDLWVMDTKKTPLVWQKPKILSKSTPSERYNHCFISIEEENKIILFGGYNKQHLNGKVSFVIKKMFGC